MTRYLTEQEIGTLLNLSKTIEVFFGRNKEDNEIISWVDLQKGKNNRIQVNYYEVYDEGSLDWLDLYAFSFVDPDKYFETEEFKNIEDAVKHIKEKYNMPEPKFLNRGGIQDEYEKLLIAEGRE
ncbi:hypothetical protein [Adhaeribacter rhizoryzae]|uniref:Uncharacterized protein n=1 Tax=Adhaeribacter rhizoryzae TaxID=2607907 RepID=A0A5M6CX40_9BACT|nr:hypothetical protein [Adhaeribacter rhizoryzae]KAA5539653.1 hypothetical protein F0145_24000 [Adhaeribacter rhizoryzae]